MSDFEKRCSWVDLKDKAYVRYHDTEWGVPVHDDQKLFEMLVLESFQAGLSWQCVLHKREAFRRAFDDFDVQKVAAYTPEKITALCQNPQIIRHKGKIESAVKNARAFIDIQQTFGSFDAFLWAQTNFKTLAASGMETTSPLSDKLAKELKKRGMHFLGSTTVFSYLCAVGLVDAHQPNCFKKHT